MAESFDAVLADARLELKHSRPTYAEIEEYLDRLQSAHEREVGELRTDLTGAVDGNIYAVQRAEQERIRADAAVGLLRFLRDRFEKHMDDSDKTAINAFLSEQAGERENGDG